MLISRWPLLSKDFLISKVDSNLFIQTFVHTDAVLDEILIAAQHVPEGEFYKNAFSCTDKLILSPGQVCVLQCVVAVCCSVLLQRVAAACCCVLKRVAAC